MGLLVWGVVMLHKWKNNKLKIEVQEVEAQHANQNITEVAVNTPTSNPNKIHYMELAQWACYGITSETDIRGVVDIIASVYAKGANTEILRKFLLEICAVETNLGRTLYNTNRGYGYGLWQFDKIAYDDVMQILSNQKDTQGLLAVLTGWNWQDVQYQDLKENALLACFFARTFIYYRVKGAIATTQEGRAQQWKKYYNTEKGAGTPQKYLSACARNGLK